MERMLRDGQIKNNEVNCKKYQSSNARRMQEVSILSALMAVKAMRMAAQNRKKLIIL